MRRATHTPRSPAVPNKAPAHNVSMDNFGQGGHNPVTAITLAITAFDHMAADVFDRNSSSNVNFTVGYG